MNENLRWMKKLIDVSIVISKGLILQEQIYNCSLWRAGTSPACLPGALCHMWGKDFSGKKMNCPALPLMMIGNARKWYEVWVSFSLTDIVHLFPRQVRTEYTGTLNGLWEQTKYNWDDVFITRHTQKWDW